MLKNVPRYVELNQKCDLCAACRRLSDGVRSNVKGEGNTNHGQLHSVLPSAKCPKRTSSESNSLKGQGQREIRCLRNSKTTGNSASSEMSCVFGPALESDLLVDRHTQRCLAPNAKIPMAGRSEEPSSDCAIQLQRFRNIIQRKVAKVQSQSPTPPVSYHEDSTQSC